MYIIGPFPQATGHRKFLLVAVDYFTKWIEAEPLASITTRQVQSFVWKDIVCRFGIPHTITDNGRQFTDRKLAEFYESLGIRHKTSSVEHPQTNGQDESANKVILNELKKRIGSAKGKWVEELVEVLWAYRCTPHSATGETSYNLTYDTDAMLPVEVGEPTIRRELHNLKINEECLRTELDLLQESRDKAKIKEEACKRIVARRHNSKTKPRAFQEGDLVWREKLARSWQKERSMQIGKALSKSEKIFRTTRIS